MLFIRIRRVRYTKLKPKFEQLCHFCDNNKDGSGVGNDNDINIYGALSGDLALHALPECGPVCFVGLLHIHHSSLHLSHLLNPLLPGPPVLGLLYDFGGVHFPETSSEKVSRRYDFKNVHCCKYLYSTRTLD